MRRVLAMVLYFEALIFGLGIPGMILVDQVRPLVAGLAAGGAALLVLVAASTLRTGVGYWLGWAGQVAGLALGLLTPMMFLAAGVFVMIWIASFIMGRRLQSHPSPGAGSTR